MKTLLKRAAIFLGLFAAGLVAHFFLAPLGYAWIVYTLAALVAAFFLLELVLRTRRRDTERADRDRWRAALYDPQLRRTAIRELRSRISSARRLGPRTRVRQARLARTLAELHQADGRSDDAIAVLAKVPVDELTPLQAAVVRLARAQAYLHGDDPEGAAATLGAVGRSAIAPDGAVEGVVGGAADGTVGDPVIDLSLRVLRGTIDLLEGRVEQARDAARDAVERTEPHDELWDEAKALEALVADDPRVLDALRPEGRARLAVIGHPRVRAWLAEP